jgi:filamentous hemagglutinin family protein
MKLNPTRLFNQQQLVRVGKNLCLSTILFFTLPIALVEAQITPDESLSTQTEQQGENRLNINGGEREGNNLFHSFQEFSVPEGIEAVFENASDIENIFTRITGEEASVINGILSTQGGANFFLVNPNGIVFGENAQLDVSGSFIATTADSVQFEDGAEFIASQGQEKPILTVSVPIGLNFEGNNGAIAVNGSGSLISRNSDVMSQNTPFNLDIDTTGLSVESGNTLALVGGNLNIKGGSLTANSGRIELGSVSSGEVSLNSISTGWALEYGTELSFKNLEFSDKSSANVSGVEEGSISIRGNNVSLKDGSILLSQSTGDTSTGILSVNASESLIISGSAPDKTASSIITETLNNGKAGDISVSANNLQLTDGGIINSSTFGAGDSGSLSIEVSNLARLSRNSLESLEIFPSNISTTSLGKGNAGEISLSVEKFLASNGSRVSSITYGSGNTGFINVNADSIEIDGLTEKDTLFGFIGSSTLNSGNSSDVTISTTSLKLLNGASVSTDSIADGTAGKVTINASESVEISGRDQNTNEESKITSSVTVEENEVVREFLGISSVPNGDAGTVFINTSKLNIIESGIVSVRNEGTGDAGTLSIDADSINLDNIGNITAETASGRGGNINIDADSLQLDENSSVTATAENNGDGGNITINTNTLIAKKNSQVTANAFAGRGGNIDINAEGLFLFDSPQNIFSASSELGIDGTIQINTPDIDLQRELEQSELELLTTQEAIAGSCLARSNRQGSFTVNNDTGLPKSPDSNYSDIDSTLTGISSLPTTAKQPEATESSHANGKRSEAVRQSNTSMLPAERMVKTENGRVFLVAAPQKPESLFCPKN